MQQIKQNAIHTLTPRDVDRIRGLLQSVEEAIAEIIARTGARNGDLVFFGANILRVVPQLQYHPSRKLAIDLVLFINGIPVATVELKTDFTQSAEAAMDQYRTDRLPYEVVGRVIINGFDGSDHYLIDYTNGNPEGGRKAMENLLQINPDINVIHTINEPAAAGAYKALKAAGIG